MNSFIRFLMYFLLLTPALLFSAAVEYNDNNDGTSYITMTFFDPEDPAYIDLTGTYIVRAIPNVEFQRSEAAYFDVHLGIVQSDNGSINFHSIFIEIYDSFDSLMDTVIVDLDQGTSGGVLKKNGKLSFSFSGENVSLNQGELVEYNLSFNGKFKKRRSQNLELQLKVSGEIKYYESSLNPDFHREHLRKFKKANTTLTLPNDTFNWSVLFQIDNADFTIYEMVVYKGEPEDFDDFPSNGFAEEGFPKFRSLGNGGFITDRIKYSNTTSLKFKTDENFLPRSICGKVSGRNVNYRCGN